MYNIIIRPIRKIKCPCSGKTTVHKLNQKELIRLNRYLNKYFRYNWQEIESDILEKIDEENKKDLKRCFPEYDLGLE